MPFLDLPPVDETPLAKGKITGIEIRCFLSSSVPPGSHSKHMQTLWQVHLHGSFLVGLTLGKQSRCLWSQPTSLELCTYQDEKLTGLTFSFQGQPLQKLAWLGPRRPSTRTEFLSLWSRPPIHRHVKGACRVLLAPGGIHSSTPSLLCETGLIPSSLPVEKLRPKEKELAQKCTCWTHTWAQHCFSPGTAVPFTRMPALEGSSGKHG